MADQPDQIWDDESEDWPKRTWDFYYPDTNTPVDNLEDAATLARRDVGDFARDLLHLPFGKAAPQRVIEEAMEHLR